MSETASEESVRMAPLVGVSAEALAAHSEEQKLTDSAESAIEALLLSLLIQTAVPSGAAAATAAHRMLALSPAALLSTIEPILEPTLLSIGLIMFRSSRRRGSTSEWQAQSARSIRQATQNILVLVNQQSRVTTEPDMYAREATGPGDTSDWARRVSHTVVTSVTEGFKAGLANRMGLQIKFWVTREDPRVRDSHVQLHGTYVPSYSKFETTSGAHLDHPGDQTAPIGEWIQCRCRLIYARSAQP